MNKEWKTSVNELISIFRGSLLAIIPWLEKANIKWKEGEAYDDWDNIVMALYENIVCASISKEVLPEYSIAKYEFHYKDYSLIDFILVMSNKFADKKYAFVSFQSNSSPLDSVKVAELDISGRVVRYLSLKQSDVEFAFIKNKEGKMEIIYEIKVML